MPNGAIGVVQAVILTRGTVMYEIGYWTDAGREAVQVMDTEIAGAQEEVAMRTIGFQHAGGK